MLRLEGITVRISGLTILRGVSLEVPKGLVVGLVGRNGAGKTTTLRAIMGLVPVVEGRVQVDGQDLTRLPAHRRARMGIGYMPEDRRLIGSLTVRENLLLPLWMSGRAEEGPQRLDHILTLLPEVRDLANRPANQLSGGQQKLVALARALISARLLALLDEPLEGISPALSARLGEVVRRYQAETGLSILVVESDLNRLHMMTNRYYILERGEVVGQEGFSPA